MTPSVRSTSRARRHAPRPRRVIRVLAEGAVTEPRYLVAWARERRQTVDLRVDRSSAGCAPLTLVGRAREQKKSQSRRDPEFDEIWCVFDVNAHPDVSSAVAEARDAGIRTAVSNPCFELWLVLHLADQTAYVDRHTIQRRARELGLINNKSIPESALPKLTDGYEEAKERAQALDAMHERAGREPGANPSSGVWRLIDSIRGDPPLD